MSNDTLVFNGIDAETGDYLLPPMSTEELSRTIRGEQAQVPASAGNDPAHDELKWRIQKIEERFFAPEEGVDPRDLAQTGWGVIFAATAGDAQRGAIAELLDHRKQQAGSLYREFLNENGYRPNDTKRTFLARFGASSGWVKPSLMPYYLLIAGSPADIPYLFQYELDVQHAVGRIWFDTDEEYRNYAHSIVIAERQPARAPVATFAGVRNTGDGATELSATELIAPLAGHVATDQPTWQVRTKLDQETTKAKLLPLFGGNETPALLFTASHGVGFSADHTLQRRHQGALLCQDWPGPGNHKGPLPTDFYLSADDIADSAELLGLIAFHFACYGAGTPQVDDFSHAKPQERKALASEAFVAQLPKRMLGHPNGGALATVGHIDRAWGYSFRSEGGRQLTSFESMLKRLMEGHPIGSAMESFNSYFAEVASDLSSAVEGAMFAKPETIDNDAIVSLWTRHNDARAYAIVGDPAVRINVETRGAFEASPYIIPAGADAPDNGAGSPADTPANDAGAETAPPADTGAFEASSMAMESSAPAPPTPDLVIRVDFDERTSPDVNAAIRPEGALEFPGLDAASDLKDTIANLVRTVAQTIQDALSDAVSLRVVTYTSDDLEQVTFERERGFFAGSARMRAVTRLSADGDTLLCLPEQDGEVDERIWAIHSEAVAHAQAYRADLIKSVLSATAGLIPK